MTDYELYLVKKAYHKKIAKGVTVLGQPIMYDPYEVYNQRKRAIIDAIAKPKFLHDNARREQAAAVARAKRNNIAAMAGTVGIGGPALAALHNQFKNRPHDLGEYGALALGGLGVGALGGGIINTLHDFKREKGEGWAKGDALDRAAFQEAQRKYDEEVAKATREFNLKYTGMEDPDKDAIYKGGIKLHDEK